MEESPDYVRAILQRATPFGSLGAPSGPDCPDPDSGGERPGTARFGPRSIPAVGYRLAGRRPFRLAHPLRENSTLAHREARVPPPQGGVIMKRFVLFLLGSMIATALAAAAIAQTSDPASAAKGASGAPSASTPAPATTPPAPDASVAPAAQSTP